MADSRSTIPPGFRGRARRTGALAWSLAGAGVQRALRGPSADKLLGEALVGHLDELKGMAMKVGQILSYMDGAMPPEAQEVLARLQTGTVGVPPATVAEVVEQALGASPEVIFERFDWEPVAAASIGQVHRARYRGREVAVKVQYPGVRATFESDMATLHRIAGLASLATAVDGGAIVEELRARLVEECDYAHEAAWQGRFAAFFADDLAVLVPEVLAEVSAGTVLTTAWVSGRPLLSEATASPAVASSVGLTLARFTWRSLFRLGSIQADPHPGNFLVLADGRVCFLDFGCIRSFDPPALEAERAVVRSVIAGDRATFDRVVDATGVVGHPAFDRGLWWELQRALLQPYLAPSHRFRPGELAAVQRLTRPTDPNLRRMALPPERMWLLRLTVGLHGVLARLGAEGPFRALMQEAVDAPPGLLEPG